MSGLGRYAAIVLAAGRSVRFGPEDKLQAKLGGRPLIAHCLAALAGAGLGRVVVVGSGAPEIAGLVDAEGFRFVINRAPERGMGHSIALGAQGLSDGWDGIFVVPADMPGIRAEDYAALAEGGRGAAAARFVHDSVPGHPVLFAGALRARLVALDGEHGGRDLLSELGQAVVRIEAEDERVVRDVDRPGDLGD